jgi:hypothetical protein
MNFHKTRKGFKACDSIRRNTCYDVSVRLQIVYVVHDVAYTELQTALFGVLFCLLMICFYSKLRNNDIQLELQFAISCCIIYCNIFWLL